MRLATRPRRWLNLVGGGALLVGLGLGATIAVPATSDAAGESLVWPFEVAVEQGVNPASHAEVFLKTIGIPVEEQSGRIAHIYRNLFEGYAVWLTPAEMERAERIILEDDIDDVVSSGRSFVVESPPTFAPSGVGALDEQLESLALRRMGMPETVVRSKAVIAILDTGVDANHPDLNVTAGFNAVDPGEPIVDVVGHGTFVSSLAAAVDDGDGIRGSAAGATIVPVKVLSDTGSGSTADIIAGLDYVAGLVLAGQRVDVANMSLGGGNPANDCGTGDDLFHEAVCALVDLDVAVVVSAGNSGASSLNQSPANYPEVVTVSAFADFDGKPGGQQQTPTVPCTAGSVDDAYASFSSFGENVDITAVGVCNIGASPTSWEHPGLTPYEPYGSGSGTSFSSPLVAGALARYRAENPDQPVRVAVEQLLRYSALYGGSISGDPDGIHEPVLWLGDIPRWEG